MKRWKPPTGGGGLPPVEPEETAMFPLGPGGFGEPGVLYNGMIAPLLPYAVRGVLWYQGEANTSTGLIQPSAYGLWFRAMISSWRQLWSDEFPFYFVQLPSNAVAGRDFNGRQWTGVREAQATALELPKTGMVVTIDLGEPELMHPTHKEPVGHRLALLAAHRIYGVGQGDDTGPELQRAYLAESKVIVEFEHAAGLATRDGGEPRGWEVMDASNQFVPAQAQIRGESVLVWNEDVPSPQGVRYAWKQNPAEANLVNAARLPAAPFQREGWK